MPKWSGGSVVGLGTAVGLSLMDPMQLDFTTNNDGYLLFSVIHHEILFDRD